MDKSKIMGSQIENLLNRVAKWEAIFIHVFGVPEKTAQILIICHNFQSGLCRHTKTHRKHIKPITVFSNPKG